MQLLELERDACLQVLFEPTPEQAALDQEARRVFSAYHTRVASMLAASGHPRELAFAATLQDIAGWNDDPAQPSTVVSATDPGGVSQVDQWLAEAATLAGDDVIAWTLLLNDDAKARAEAAAHWQALEPDNLAAWLAGDPTAEALFTAARQASYYDNHNHPRVRWMANVLQTHPPTAEEAPQLMTGVGLAHQVFDVARFAATAAFAIDAAVAMPALGPLMEGCDGVALAATSSRREDCRHIANLLLDDSGSLLAESMGIGLLDRLAHDQAELAVAAERQRGFDWRMEQYLRLVDENDSAASDVFLQLFADTTIANERELIERLLRDANVSLQPPADWVSPRPQG